MLLRLTVLAAALLAASAAPAAEGAWGAGQKASIRLLAAGVDDDGRLSAGIEIVMPEGWHTYWRSPGDAGIAPSFDFTGSDNVSDVTVGFPVPTRYDDGFNVTNVYRQRVVLPITAEVPDPSGNVDLSVAVEIGVCANICVPDTVSARLTLPAGAEDDAVAATLAAARAALPGAPEDGFAVRAVTRDGGTDKRPVFVVHAAVPDEASADIFIEGPENWAAYRPDRATGVPGEVAWTVKFSRLGAKDAPADASFRVTLVSGGRAIEQVVPAN